MAVKKEVIDDLRYKGETRDLSHPLLDRIREECQGTNKPPAPQTHGQYALAAAAVLCKSTVGAFACQKCGWPYVNGQSCTFCKDVEPYESAKHESRVEFKPPSETEPELDAER